MPGILACDMITVNTRTRSFVTHIPPLAIAVPVTLENEYDII